MPPLRSLAVRPRALLAIGGLLIVAALALAAAGAAARGPLNPSCPGCASWGARALFVAALIAGVAGAVLAAMGLARLEPEPRK